VFCLIVGIGRQFMDYELAKSQANICKVFGNARRVLILWTLLNGEKSVGQIADAVDTSLQNTSQHLRLMQDKGVLRSRRAGSTVYYRINYDLIDGCRLLAQGQREPPESA
jgi:ArsR family transcriptional regulator